MSETADAELNALRIRRIASEQRAANRFRSYLIIGGLVAAAVLVQIAMVWWRG